MNSILVLIAGDLIAMLAFAWIGRGSHNLSMTDLGAVWAAAAPFIIAWFLVTPWFGLFRAEISRNWRKLLPRLLAAWAIGGPLALVLRTLFLGRPIPGGIIPSFALVALAVTTLFMVAWRLGYVWWVQRGSGQNRERES